MSDVRKLDDDLSALESQRAELTDDRERLATGRLQWDEEAHTLERLLAAHNARKDTLDQAEHELDSEDEAIKLELGYLKTAAGDLRADRKSARADEDTELGRLESGLRELAAEVDPPARTKRKKK